ncbi:MAG: 16S rRNA (cytosine(967)-C(5))-methyltransferase RsmB [Lachnospiraceae bacterium]|nr:16S rRNA (cytosine(967)-C(5))-methyltransferase RsmB [Lachnospiraceae bacterium]
MENTREIILECLLELEKGEVFSNVLIRQVLQKYDYFPTQEKAFIKRVTEGTLERLIELDYIIDQFSSVPVSKMKPLIRQLMRMSVYQLLYMDAVPDSAVCNEAVKLAKKRHFQSLKGFVNGVLRNIARNKEKIVWPDMEKEWERAVSVRYSMPEFIVKLWEQDYGRQQTEKMCESLLEMKPVSLRISEELSAKEQEKLTKEWKERGILCEKHPYLSYAWICRNLEGLHRLPGFAEGIVTVQDVSSMLVTECAGIRTGDFVLDVCAAPGGKTLHAACKLRGSGQVEARDVSEDKAELIRENIRRMGAENVGVKVWDARVFDEDMEGKADVLYLDLPCSGLGVLGKKRDIKYHVSKESLEELVKLQREIIQTCWRYVRPGGVIIYSTCTVHRRENEEQVEWMCGEFPLVRENLNLYLQKELQCAEAESGMLQLMPGSHDCDGFFLARLRRSE